MVSIGYLIDKPDGPSPLLHFINTRIVPSAIDAAGAVESAVYEAGEKIRAQPAPYLLAAGILGLVLGAAAVSARR